MVDLPWDGLPAAPGLLKTITGANDMTLGVHARVVRGGILHVGDVQTVGCSAPHTPWGIRLAASMLER
jgi:hypothetical protein